jgi:hypothetical protein
MHAMVADRDEQIQRLARQHDVKDRTIAELRPLLKESQRASVEAKQAVRAAANVRNWKF